MKAFTLKFELEDSDPAIVRTVAVPEFTSFADLHSIVQSVMTWSGFHQHVFKVDDVSIGPAQLDCEDEEYIAISDYFGKPIRYNYDFGDNWWISISWEDTIEDFGHIWPILIDWKEDNPPEDCGGIDNYYQILDALDNPEHKFHEDAVEIAQMAEFDEYIVENSLQAWPVQGVRKEGSEYIPNEIRIVLLMAMSMCVNRTIVFDMDEMTPLLVESEVPRRSERHTDTSKPTVEPEVVRANPSRYPYVIKTGDQGVYELLNGFRKKNPKSRLPVFDGTNTDAFLEAVFTKKKLKDMFWPELLEFMSGRASDWLHENGFYVRTQESVNMAESVFKKL